MLPVCTTDGGTPPPLCRPNSTQDDPIRPNAESIGRGSQPHPPSALLLETKAEVPFDRTVTDRSNFVFAHFWLLLWLETRKPAFSSLFSKNLVNLTPEGCSRIAELLERINYEKAQHPVF
jgi:hypothetical protein